MLLAVHWVNAYTENGWAHHIINPDGHSPTSDGFAEVDCSVSPPTTGWKNRNRF